MYCGMLPPLMKFMTFDEFYDTMTGKNIDFRPDDEILAEAEAIRRNNGT